MYQTVNPYKRDDVENKNDQTCQNDCLCREIGFRIAQNVEEEEISGKRIAYHIDNEDDVNVIRQVARQEQATQTESEAQHVVGQSCALLVEPSEKRQ